MGYVVSSEGLGTDPSKLRAITDMLVPIDKQGVILFCLFVVFFFFCQNKGRFYDVISPRLPGPVQFCKLMLSTKHYCD